ncbi:MAG: trehalase family glycosidase, partial [Chloroflexota bacterium]
PLDHYTPHGYLDNPAHRWKVGPGGVLRSCPAIGVGWHYPSFAGAYNSTFIYRAGLQLGFQLSGGRSLLETNDFKKAGIDLYCDYHSKNLLRYVFHTPENLQVTVSFFLADQATGDVLTCLLRFENLARMETPVYFSTHLDYKHDLSKSLTWGSELYHLSREGGFGTGYRAEHFPDLPDQIGYPHWGTTIGVFQEGTTFHLMQAELVSRQTLKGQDPLPMEPLREFRRLSPMYGTTEEGSRPAHLIGTLTQHLLLEAGQSTEFLILMGRGETEIQAVRKVQPYFLNLGEQAKAVLAEREANDTAFWEETPKLGGDWPGYLRRGPTYDLETLRMLVRRPMGLYKHPWDAMQLQVPRTVLAEAALDMLILSYADPETAKAVLYGTFADAPEPNVPCSREDGSYNMVALDGSPCGTAPEWCFPFHCINLVYLRTGDKAWLGQLFPLLENFIHFWLAYRQDSQGRPFYKCSWEAGQDNSARFGIKADPSGGGALTTHLWPVDLQAALAQSCELLANWAEELGQDGSRWQTEALRHKSLMQQLWHNNWFHDFDTTKNTFTSVMDTMQLAPLLCGVATPSQITTLAPKLVEPPKHGQVFHPLMWPSTAFCLIEACSEAGRLDLAARHSWAVLEGVYRWLDSRPEAIEGEAGGLPGVGREYWPQVVTPQAHPPSGGGGAEVYGWGCLGTLLLYRYIIGFREEPSKDEKLEFSLRPDLPASLLAAGKTYTVGPFRHHNARVSLVYRPTNGKGQLQIGVSINLVESANLTVFDESHQPVYQSSGPNTRHQIVLSSLNGQNLRFILGNNPTAKGSTR